MIRPAELIERKRDGGVRRERRQQVAVGVTQVGVGVLADVADGHVEEITSVRQDDRSHPLALSHS